MTRLLGSRRARPRRQGEDRREKRGEKREKREDRRQTRRGRQRSPNEAARGGPTLFYIILPRIRPHLGTEGRGKRAERRETRENDRQLDSLHFYGVPWPLQRSYENQKGPPKLPQARIPAFLRCPVTTSMRTPKTPTSVRGSFSQKC